MGRSSVASNCTVFTDFSTHDSQHIRSIHWASCLSFQRQFGFAPRRRIRIQSVGCLWIGQSSYFVHHAQYSFSSASFLFNLIKSYIDGFQLFGRTQFQFDDEKFQKFQPCQVPVPVFVHVQNGTSLKTITSGTTQGPQHQQQKKKKMSQHPHANSPRPCRPTDKLLFKTCDRFLSRVSE